MVFGPLPLPLLDCDNFFLKPLLSVPPLAVLLKWRVEVVFGMAFIPTFRTVFVEAELFNDDRELRRLVLDPLRSTSNDRVFGPLSNVRARSEFVRMGVMVVRV